MNKVISLILSIVAVNGCTPKQSNSNKIKNRLPLKRLIESPSLSGELPRSIKISPNGKKLTFLKAKKTDFAVLDLWEFDLNSGKQSLLVDSTTLTGGKEEKVSDEERARRERKRIRSSGIVEYHWSKQGDQILFPVGGDLYVYSMENKTLKRITETESPELDPQFSPKGNYLSFIRNNNLYVYDLKANKEKQISFSGTVDKPVGVAEFIAQEEMRRFRGYWWSADEGYVAATLVDLTPVEQVKRFEIYADKVEVIEQRYPSTGTNNAVIGLKVFDLEKAGKKQKGQKIQISSKDYYIPQARWNKAKLRPQFFYTIQSRDQKTLEMYAFDPTTSQSKLVLTEKDPAWVNIRHDYKFLTEGNNLLWVSERSGYSHIYKIDPANGKTTALTEGDWDVMAIESVDSKSKMVYFTGKKDSPLENHLYKVDLDGKKQIQKVSQEPGSHRISMVDDPEFYLDYHSSSTKLTSVASHDLEGKRKFFIEENKIDKDHPLGAYIEGFANWEYHELKSEGQPTLYYKVLKPKNFSPSKKYPIIQYVYGGPGVQLVTRSWSRQNYFFQILAQKGFIVIVGDNRGTPNRGRDFERSYYLKFGQIEIEDQSRIVESYAKNNSFVEKDRIGVFGHSYGGYLSLMLIMQKNETYKVAVSGAPVVDWKLYDTHYTERYIGTPQAQPEAYKKSNVLSHTDKLSGKLLVAHGMADDNVLYSNSLMLYSDLQEKGKLFDVQAYPGAKHGIRRKKSWQHHYYFSILSYFTSNL